MRNHLKLGDRYFQVDVLSRSPLRVLIKEGDESKEWSATRELAAGEGRIDFGDGYQPYFVSESARGIWVTVAGHGFFFEKGKAARGAQDSEHADFGAPMPGKVIQVKVAVNKPVQKGQTLVIMEAMKMEHRIEAPSHGRVTAFHCTEGQLVDQGFTLLDFETGAADSTKSG